MLEASVLSSAELWMVINGPMALSRLRLLVSDHGRAGLPSK